jgi:hypothetical protein
MKGLSRRGIPTPNNGMNSGCSICWGEDRTFIWVGKQIIDICHFGKLVRIYATNGENICNKNIITIQQLRSFFKMSYQYTLEKASS